MPSLSDIMECCCYGCRLILHDLVRFHPQTESKVSSCDGFVLCHMSFVSFPENAV